MARKPCHCGGDWTDRRRLLAGMACAGIGGLFSGVARAEAVLSPAQAIDEAFMRLALEEARKGDLPFGAVIVRKGKVAARGRNIGVKTNDPTAHGEMVAIRRFVARRPADELKGATIYTTGEPCPMCMGAIIWSGFGRVVYAASIEQLSTRLGQIMLSTESVAQAAPFIKIDITSGVLSAEALALFDKK